MAVYPGYVTRHLLPQQYDASQLKAYETPQACLKAVRDGKADIVFLPKATAVYEVQNGDYPELVLHGGIPYTYEVGAAVSHAGDAALLRILDKEVRHLGTSEVQALLDEAGRASAQHHTAKSLLYTYADDIALGLFLASFVASLILWRVSRQRHRHVEEIQHVLYHDGDTGRRNERWFLDAGRRLLAGMPEAERQRCYVIVLLMRQLDSLRATHGIENVRQLFRQMDEQLDGEASWVRLHGMNALAGRILLLAQGEELVALEAHVEAFLRDNEYLSIGEMMVHSTFTAGIVPMAEGQEDFADALNDAVLAASSNGKVKVFDSKLREQTKLPQFRCWQFSPV